MSIHLVFGALKREFNLTRLSKGLSEMQDRVVMNLIKHAEWHLLAATNANQSSYPWDNADSFAADILATLYLHIQNESRELTHFCMNGCGRTHKMLVVAYNEDGQHVHLFCPQSLRHFLTQVME